tara:strand:- start:183 stop:1535 length:1353 start_codon:yes stop_codon:yes gene_type:complete
MKIKYDLIVIGGGSGGVRAARIAAQNGAKVALCEKSRMGGTCVIRGCIPKKLLFYAAQQKDFFKAAEDYGWESRNHKNNFPKLIKNKNNELNRLEKLYEKTLIKNRVKIYKGSAKFIDSETIKVSNNYLQAKKIIIAVGGKTKMLNIEGKEHCIGSDEIMDLQSIPKKLTILGGGYIAIEFAFIFASLGSKVSLISRSKILRKFDKHLVTLVEKKLKEKNVELYSKQNITKIQLKNKKKQVFLKNKKKIEADEVLIAIGRTPNIDKLNLEYIGIKINSQKAIKVDKNLKTNIKNIYAIGDVTDRINLTPVAIAEGQALSLKLFGNKNNKINLEYVGSAVFSQPPICSIGLSEEEAKKKYKKLKIYESTFTSLKYSIVKIKTPTYIKLIVNESNKRVIAGHMFGEEAPELIQMIGVAIDAKATIDNFINTMAIHPTTAEEFVTFSNYARKI